jgi:hypothetical protein
VSASRQSPWRGGVLKYWPIGNDIANGISSCLSMLQHPITPSLPDKKSILSAD